MFVLLPRFLCNESCSTFDQNYFVPDKSLIPDPKGYAVHRLLIFLRMRIPPILTNATKPPQENNSIKKTLSSLYLDAIASRRSITFIWTVFRVLHQWMSALKEYKCNMKISFHFPLSTFVISSLITVPKANCYFWRKPRRLPIHLCSVLLRFRPEDVGYEALCPENPTPSDAVWCNYRGF